MSRALDTAKSQQSNSGPTPPFVAGKNKIINGDFGIWQRGTSFTASGYTADRWYLSRNNTTTVSQQTFTPGTAPVSGYEGTYFLRCARTSGSSDDYLLQRVEDMRTFAGQTITISFWAKADTATTISQVYCACNPGSGGSGAPGGVGNFSGVAITTSWARYTVTTTMASSAGSTIGTSSFVEIVFKFAAAMGNRTVDIWGVQWETGSAATPFQTATGTIQGELAACQRYFQTVQFISSAKGVSSTNVQAAFPCLVHMRAAPSAAISGTVLITNDTSADYMQSSANITVNTSTTRGARVNMGNFSGLSSGSIYAMYNSDANSYHIQLSAEL